MLGLTSLAALLALGLRETAPRVLARAQFKIAAVQL
jgi:hypothetical protein